MISLSRSTFAAFSIAFFAGGCSKERQHVSVSGPIHIAANVAVTLKSPEPLRAPNYWNALCLQPSTPNALASNGTYGVLSATGEQFFPKVFLRNEAGTEDAFESSVQMGSIDGLWLCFEPTSHQQPLHTPYLGVRIISPTDLELKAIKWHSSDA
jgi:hypothetical protein